MNPEPLLLAAAIFVVCHAVYSIAKLIVRCPEQRVFDDLEAMGKLFNREVHHLSFDENVARGLDRSARSDRD